MRSFAVLCVFVGLSWTLALGCALSDLAPSGANEAAYCDGDAGDGGDCEPPPDVAENVGPPGPGDFDGGLNADAVQDGCEALVRRVCGEPPGATCEEDATCIAAGLMRDYASEGCEEALADQVRFPACTLGPCDVLVDKVCGALEGEAPCPSAPGCDPARELRARAEGDDADEAQQAESSCAAALDDDVVFAACGG
jgi:hypothetical protein